jgi:pimeloyl-ACP methyl ester carboxylesterase
LLVHGFASSFERNWKDTGFSDLLADAGREVIGPDLLGHGKADKPHDPRAYADLEGDLERHLPSSGTIDAVGFSLGARVLLGVAARHPDRFGRIVVGGVGANLFRGGDPEPIARAVTGDVDAEHPVARFFAAAAAGSGNDREALAACLRRPDSGVGRDALARITCPVLVVLGDRDFAGPADPLLEALPDARLVTLTRCDHFATPKDFRFLDAALDFLDAQS